VRNYVKAGRADPRSKQATGCGRQAAAGIVTLGGFICAVPTSHL